MFNDVFVDFNNKMFNEFVERTKKKFCLHEPTKEIVELIIACLKEEALKEKKNTMVSLGFEDAILEKAIIKANNFLPQYRESKKKEKKEAPKNKTVGNTYYDKKGQKHTKKETPVNTDFNLEQLGLFDLD